METALAQAVWNKATAISYSECVDADGWEGGAGVAEVMGDSIHSSRKTTSVISGRFGGQCLSALGEWMLLRFLIGCHVRSLTPIKMTLIDSLPKKEHYSDFMSKGISRFPRQYVQVPSKDDSFSEF